MKSIYLKYMLLALVITLCSCEKVVELDLNDVEPRLVVDAEILWDKGTAGNEQSIKLTTSTGYYNTTVPTVSGAVIYVTNDTSGDTFSFPESQDAGVYTCTDFVPVLNQSYTLHIELNGEVYAATETFMEAPVISRMEYADNGGFSGDKPEVKIYFQDNASEVNYYLTEFNAPVIVYPNYELSDDEFFEGNEISTDFSHDDLETGDVVDIRLRGISERFYNYMNLILDSTSGNPFGTPPSTIRGNLINTTHPDNFVLGYFRLNEADHQWYAIP